MISSDRNRREVVWRMTPMEALTIADFISVNTDPTDPVRRDANSLREAALRLEPLDPFRDPFSSEGGKP